ncbi:hypothetical protein ACHQM5_011759 [Ranunculus cassubicifolius]
MTTPSLLLSNGETLNPLNPQIQPSIPQSPINKPSIESKPSITNSITEKRKREENTEIATDNSKTPLWKTSLCSYFRRNDGSCSHGETCRYAHGEAELRIRPDHTWDPTSERAKKIMKLEEEEKIAEVMDAREDVLMMMNQDEEEGEVGLSKCLVNLPRNWVSDGLKKYLDEQGVIYKTVKKKKGMTVGFASFESADQVKNAIEILDGKSMGNKYLKVADVLPRSFERKSQSATSNASAPLNGSENAEVDENGDPTVNSLASKSRSVRDAVTPLAHMPYADQLEQKKTALEKNLKKLTRNARKACPEAVPLPEWIQKSRDIAGLPCKLEGIIESPLVNGYRNKCEFSVGCSLQGKPTVGFLLGNFREGVLAVEEPTDCPNVSSIACKFASTFQGFLQLSGLPIWNRLNNTGFWRQLTVREGRSQSVGSENLEDNISEVLLMVQISSADFDDELVKSELHRLAEAFIDEANGSSPPLPLTSLVVQDHKGISNVAPADAPLYPLPIKKKENASADDTVNDGIITRIHDHISNLRFSISPTAFFQVNTLAAEKLYALAGDWAGLGPDTLLFDVCCGTGTIGLTLAHRVGMVVGIEMNASAVSDANRNAEINGIKNCRFVCGKAEDVMGSLLKEYLSVSNKQKETPNSTDQDGNSKTEEESEEKNGITVTSEPQYKNIVAIVDPPRAGLHPVVIKALRTHPRLRRLVYVSCNPESLVANAIELCTPSAEKGEKENKGNRGWRKMSSASLARQRTKSMPDSEPFSPVKAMAVDLFPHTPHCELVMLLER